MTSSATTRLEQSLNQLQAKSAARRKQEKPPKPKVTASVPVEKPAKPAKPKTSLRPKPRGDAQGDFFAPPLYEVGTRDHRALMDVAVFRLSKKEKRANTIIRYDLPDGFIEVSSGPYGMASVWDYDLVLMSISHLTEAMNRFREGKGEKPPQVFTAHVADILKFCRRDPGGKQKESLKGALMRLYTTVLLVERPTEKGRLRVMEPQSLIGSFKLTSHATTDKVEQVEITIAEWMYKEITQNITPGVLTVHPDYFLIDVALGRFVYRLARQAAGKDFATWGFDLLHVRSGSNARTSEFNRMLRAVIETNDLPEYHLIEKAGRKGPLLVMVYRKSLDHLKNVLKEDEWAQPEQPD